MKKLLAIILALTIVLSMAACGGAAAPDATKNLDAPTVAQGGTSINAYGSVITNYDSINDVDPAVKDSLPHFNVLVTYTQFTDKLGSQYKACIEYICEQLNCTPTFVECGTTIGDEAISILQSALVNDYDFCLGIGTSEGVLKVFEGAKVPYVSVGSILSDAASIEIARNYEYFLGCVSVDDYGAMAEGARTLYELGCRNVVWNGLPLGLSGQHDQRLMGFEETAASLGMNLLTENMDYAAWADGISNAAAAYPELDGVGCTALAENIYNTVVNEGLQDKIKLCGIDITEGTGQSFEDGYLAYIAGGNYICMQIGFAVCYNYVLDGTRIMEDNGTNLLWNNIHIHNTEEFNNYVKYLDSGVPGYTAQEILEMTHWYNNDFTPDDLIALGQAFTMEDVMARHADLVQ